MAVCALSGAWQAGREHTVAELPAVAAAQFARERRPVQAVLALMSLTCLTINLKSRQQLHFVGQDYDSHRYNWARHTVVVLGTTAENVSSI